MNTSINLPNDWRDLFIDALSSVIHDHGLTMSKVLGKQYSHLLMSEVAPSQVLRSIGLPTVKKLAPCLAAHGIRLSEVVLRAEELWRTER